MAGPDPLFEVRIQRQHGVALVSLFGELDVLFAHDLEQQLMSIALDGGGILVDLKALTFLDCSGLRSLLTARDIAQIRSEIFAFTGGSGIVRKVFSLTGHGDLLDSAAGRDLRAIFMHGARPMGAIA